jgi:hypothetical protein
MARKTESSGKRGGSMAAYGEKNQAQRIQQA